MIHPRAQSGKARYHPRIPPRYDNAQTYNASRSPASAQAAWERILLRSNKKSPRGPRALSDRRPSNRPRAQTPKAASAGRSTTNGPLFAQRCGCGAMTEARRREGVGFRPRPSNDAASGELPRLSAKQMPIGAQNARLGRGLGRGARSGTPHQCKRSSTAVEPAKTKRLSSICARPTALHRSAPKISVRDSPACINLPPKHRCAWRPLYNILPPRWGWNIFLVVVPGLHPGL